MFVIANTEDMQYVKVRLCVITQHHIPSSNLLLFTQQFFYSSVYIASNGGAMVTSKVERMWKEMIMT